MDKQGLTHVIEVFVYCRGRYSTAVVWSVPHVCAQLRLEHDTLRSGLHPAETDILV